MEQETMVLTTTHDGYAVLTLHRPAVRNALSTALMNQLVAALEGLQRDATVRCVVLTGDERAFAAGADIAEMAAQSAVEMARGTLFEPWQRLQRIALPLIAAVNGYALGGGFELAMNCDMIVAADNAVFGLPEVSLGVIPGAGGTQRLTRAIGKARAMEVILAGARLDAQEAYGAGLVTRVVPAAECLQEAEALAARIARQPPLAVRLAKQAVLQAFETSLATGLEQERQSFLLLFASEDQKEGMRAFLEKRPPTFHGR